LIIHRITWQQVTGGTSSRRLGSGKLLERCKYKRSVSIHLLYNSSTAHFICLLTCEGTEGTRRSTVMWYCYC